MVMACYSSYCVVNAKERSVMSCRQVQTDLWPCYKPFLYQMIVSFPRLFSPWRRVQKNSLGTRLGALTTQNFTTAVVPQSISSQIVLYSNQKACALIHEIYFTSMCLVTSYFCQVSKLASLFHSPTFAQNCPRSPHAEPQQAKPCTQPPRSAHQHQEPLI